LWLLGQEDRREEGRKGGRRENEKERKVVDLNSLEEAGGMKCFDVFFHLVIFVGPFQLELFYSTAPVNVLDERLTLVFYRKWKLKLGV